MTTTRKNPLVLNAGATVPIANALTTAEQQLALHELMVRARAPDAAMAALFQRRNRRWFTCVGEDGVVVGATYGLQRGDVVATHYRGALMVGMIRGVALRTLIASCLGTVDSYNRGRMRGDVAGAIEYGLIGCYSGNLGPQLSYGTGAAWAMKLRKLDNVAIVMFGDGTAHRGEFHEAVNFAALRKLAVVYVCQNNQHAVCSSLAQQTACRTFAERAIGYGMPGEQVDGNDVLAVSRAVSVAVDRARRGDGPTLIDALTCRAPAGCGDPAPIEQPAAEVRAWRRRDPLLRLQRQLLRTGLITRQAISICRTQAEDEVAKAVAQAQQGAFPGADEVDPALVCAPAHRRECASWPA